VTRTLQHNDDEFAENLAGPASEIQRKDSKLARIDLDL